MRITVGSRTRAGGRQRRPILERLESRALLNGDVTLRLSGGNLFIQGDNAGDSIALSPGKLAGEVVVTGQDGTLIDGAASETVTVGKNIFITLGGGSNSVVVGGEESQDATGVSTSAESDEGPTFFLPGDLNITTGNGNDWVRVRSTAVAGSMSIDTGSGDDIVTLGRGPTFQPPDSASAAVASAAATTDEETCTGPSPDVTVGGAVRIDTGNGNDAVKVAFTSIGTNLTIATGTGNDQIVTGRGPIAGVHGGGGGGGSEGGGCEDDMSATADEESGGRPTDVTVGSAVKIMTGSGDDFLMLRNMVASTLDVSTGDGNDALGLQNIQITGATSLDTFQGDDLVAVFDSTFDGRFDLRTGTGDDSVWVSGSDFTGPATFNGGPGSNQIIKESTNSMTGPTVIQSFTTVADPTALEAEMMDVFGPFMQGRGGAGE